MTEFPCAYGDDRDAAIVTFLYDEPDADPAERASFEAHLRACARCQTEIAALRGVRAELGSWSPREPSFAIGQSLSPTAAQPSVDTQPHGWRTIPAWAQLAAAMLFLGVSAGIANLDVQYNKDGLKITTGWSSRSGQPVASAASGATSAASTADAAKDAPWRADIAALERQLMSEIRAAQASSPAGPAQTLRTVSGTADADVSHRVRALVEESEKRQERELALRLAELARDVTAQRQADMVKIDRTLGLVQNNVGIEVMRNREKMNQMDLIYRASQRQ
ncbi:MAG: anti-sigma factor family protein [Vicinamibacterales bacterium]